MKRIIFCVLMAMCLTGCVSAEPANVSYETSVTDFEIKPNDGLPTYDAIVEVKNTGDIAINLGYTAFSVIDSEGKLVVTENSSAIYALPSVVYPGEVGYYFAAGIELPSNIDTSLTYNLLYDTDYIRPADTEGVIDYEVVNVSFPENDYMNVIGEIVNGSDNGDVDVLCICYDESGKIVTMGGTIEELKTEHNTYFEIINYGARDKNSIANYKMIARTHSYD